MVRSIYIYTMQLFIASRYYIAEDQKHWSERQATWPFLFFFFPQPTRSSIHLSIQISSLFSSSFPHLSFTSSLFHKRNLQLPRDSKAVRMSTFLGVGLITINRILMLNSLTLGPFYLTKPCKFKTFIIEIQRSRVEFPFRCPCFKVLHFTGGL